MQGQLHIALDSQIVAIPHCIKQLGMNQIDKFLSFVTTGLCKHKANLLLYQLSSNIVHQCFVIHECVLLINMHEANICSSVWFKQNVLFGGRGFSHSWEVVCLFQNGQFLKVNSTSSTFWREKCKFS